MTSEVTSLIERVKVTIMKTKNLSIFQQQTQVQLLANRTEKEGKEPQYIGASCLPCRVLQRAKSNVRF